MSILVRQKTIINRFRQADLEQALKKWKYLDEKRITDVVAHKTKGDKINELMKICGNISEEHLGELELIYMQIHSKSKLWTVYQLKPIEGIEDHLLIDGVKLQRKLKKELNCYFDVVVNVSEHESAYWIRLHITEETSEHTTFIVHYPHTDILIIHRLKASQAEYVLQGFMTVLRCSEAKPLSLQGKCVQSLAQLSIHKTSQGSFSKYRLNQADVNPLSSKRPRRSVEVEEYDCRIQSEVTEETARKMKILEDTFGTNEQPTLEKVEFKLETPFRGHRYATGMSKMDTFQCRVKFEGESVLEGIRNLAEAGYADLPMKSHLSQIHSRARNVFVLQPKARSHSMNLTN